MAVNGEMRKWEYESMSRSPAPIRGISLIVRYLWEALCRRGKPLPVQEGDPAPDFRAVATGGRTVRLSDYAGKKNVVLWFFPMADTRICTQEGCAFRDNLGTFESADTAVIGASLDPLPDQEAFARKYGYTFPLISDPEGLVASAYGTARKGDRFASRMTFVIGKTGKISKIFEGVNVAGHVEEVLRSLPD